MPRFNFSRLSEVRGERVLGGLGVIVVVSASFILAMLASNMSYCVVIMAAVRSTTVLLPVVAAARAPKFLSNCAIRTRGRPGGRPYPSCRRERCRRYVRWGPQYQTRSLAPSPLSFHIRAIGRWGGRISAKTSIYARRGAYCPTWDNLLEMS